MYSLFFQSSYIPSCALHNVKLCTYVATSGSEHFPSQRPSQHVCLTDGVNGTGSHVVSVLLVFIWLQVPLLPADDTHTLSLHSWLSTFENNIAAVSIMFGIIRFVFRKDTECLDRLFVFWAGLCLLKCTYDKG
jgi:hypothetical protein